MGRYENTNGKDISEERVMTEAETGVWATSQELQMPPEARKRQKKKKEKENKVSAYRLKGSMVLPDILILKLQPLQL